MTEKLIETAEEIFDKSEINHPGEYNTNEELQYLKTEVVRMMIIYASQDL